MGRSLKSKNKGVYVVNCFDFHLHSYFSDGRLSPQDLIRACKENNLKTVALTDHENVKGIPWAVSEGKKLGVKVVPGIEFASEFEGEECHFLGLDIEYNSAELAEFLKRWEGTKTRQIEEMVKGLDQLGFFLEFNEVATQACGAINRAHIAYAVFDKPENKSVFERLNIYNSNDFFVRFLKESSPVYVKRVLPKAIDVIGLIKRLKGWAIWAHPIWKNKDLALTREKAAYFQRFGLDGMEVGYSKDYQSFEETRVLHQIAGRLYLLETAGSDFHSYTIPILNKIANFELMDIKLNLPKFSRET